VCAGHWGRAAGRLGERLRRAVDLEHWSAFNTSFERLCDWLREVSEGTDTRRPPATIVLLGGDVHNAYVSEVALGQPTRRAESSRSCARRTVTLSGRRNAGSSASQGRKERHSSSRSSRASPGCRGRRPSGSSCIARPSATHSRRARLAMGRVGHRCLCSGSGRCSFDAWGRSASCSPLTTSGVACRRIGGGNSAPTRAGTGHGLPARSWPSPVAQRAWRKRMSWRARGVEDGARTRARVCSGKPGRPEGGDGIRANDWWTD
jgi:hypothetical protein